MNYPPNLLNSPNFKKIIYNMENTSHNNSNYNNEIEFHQNLAKKLLKYNNSSKNLQLSVFSYLRSKSTMELIKICSLNSKWFIDIVHQLILFSKLDSQLLKFLYENKKYNEYEDISMLINNDNINYNNIIKDKEEFTKFTNYFETIESKFISLSKKIPERKNFGKTLIQSIRYLTINSNKENFKKEYNNILTLSFDFLSDFDKLKETFLKISKNECFKNPIIIKTICDYNNNMNENNNNKIIYNFELPKWIINKESFTVDELLCAYFEQIILLHFQYDTLYHTKIIPFPFENKLDELLEQSKKIINFIENTNEKDKLFSELNFQSIYEGFKNDNNINEIINKRRENDKCFSFYYENNNRFREKIKTIIEQIDVAKLCLQKCLFEGYKYFVEMLYFTKDNIVGTIEDFVNKKICEQINNLFCQKVTNDLINDNIEEQIIVKKKKKRKHHKKKKLLKEENENENENEKTKNDFIINKIEDVELNNNKNINKEILDLNNNNKKDEETNYQQINLNETNNNINKTVIEENNSIYNENIIITIPKSKKEKKKKPFFLYPVNKSKKNNEMKNNIEKNKNDKLENKFENDNLNYNKNEIIQSQIFSPKKKSFTKNLQIENNNISQNLSYSSISPKKKKYNSNYNSPNQNKQNIYTFKSHHNNNMNTFKKNVHNNYNKFEQINYQNSNSYQNIFSPYKLISNSICQLTKEIEENTKSVNYNKEILLKYRIQYIEKLISIITSILNNNKINFSIEKYGSYVSGLSIENSDIDLMIKIYYNKNSNNNNNININDVISILMKEFNNEENKNFFTKINPIYTASVPVIKLETDIYDSIKDENIKNYFINNYKYDLEEIKKLKFDITFFEINEKDKNIKLPSEQILEFIKENINLYPCIIDIIYIMKRYIQAQELNLSYKGGISSYSLFLLILSFIKANKDNLKVPIGILLIEFINFYSNFDFGNYIINPKKEEKNEIYEFLSKENDNYILYIKDPFSGLNVSKSSFKIREIQFAFFKASNYIIDNLYIYSNKHLDKNIISNSKDNFLNGLLIK